MTSKTLLLALLLAINVHLGTCGNETRQLPPLGRAMRSEFYMEDDDYLAFNHGAYGTYPKVVGETLRQYQERSEKNPDLWLRRDAKTELAKVRQMLADLIDADSDDVVMVPNTTSGMNAILRSLVFAVGERILHLSTIYMSMDGIIQYLVDYSNGTLSRLVMNVTYPMGNNEFLQQFETFLEETDDPERPIRLALVDHISSVPAVIVPIDKIIPMLKSRNITVLIDGAHAIGHVPINISALAPDYYVTSCHKWLYAARGCGLLYVDKKHQGTIHPALINVGYKQPRDFQEEFYWTGTMDYSSYMTVPHALEFRREVGGEDVIMKYNHNLAWEGGNLVASRLQTRVLQEEYQMGSMIDIQLPINNPGDPMLTNTWFIDEQLFGNYNYTFSTIYEHGGVWWGRLSAQIYNDLADFEIAAKMFLDICNAINSGYARSEPKLLPIDMLGS